MLVVLSVCFSLRFFNQLCFLFKAWDYANNGSVSDASWSVNLIFNFFQKYTSGSSIIDGTCNSFSMSDVKVKTSSRKLFIPYNITDFPQENNDQQLFAVIAEL